jgi:hypothetical protein
MQWSRLVPDNNNTTIKQWTKGLGRKWPGGIVWAAIRTSPFYHVVIMLKNGLFGVGCGGFEPALYLRLKKERNLTQQ